MVWGLFPVDPLSGEEKYYMFTKGTYKVGRKGCDLIISKDKGVSRIHAEILVDEMISLNPLQNKLDVSSAVRIRDCSKYGTFINRNLGPKEKIHEFPNKETTLRDGDLVSFGTGSATYRFCFVPLIFFYCTQQSQTSHPLQGIVSSIGARITHHLSEDCTHVLVDELMPVKEDLVDSVVAKKPLVLNSWVELVAEKGIGTEIPDWSSYLPTLAVEGLSVKVADSGTRANCLRGYTFFLEPISMYKFGGRFQSLLEVGGAKIILLEESGTNSQNLDYGENSHLVCVIPGGSADKFNRLSKLSSLQRVNEVDLLCAVLSGHLDSSLLTSPAVLVSSSCSTDETIVPDSDPEQEVVSSVPVVPITSSEDVPECVTEAPISQTCSRLEANHVTSSMDDYGSATRKTVKDPIWLNKTEEVSIGRSCNGSESDHVASSMYNYGGMTRKIQKDDEPQSGNSEIIYSQALIVRDLSSPSALNSITNDGVPNFKHFRKGNITSGNSFNKLIPFAKYPYKECDYGNQEVLDSVKNEKKRKQMESASEDLFNNQKGKRRGVAGSLHRLLGHA